MDWAAQTRGYLSTGQRRPTETHELSCGDPRRPLDWVNRHMETHGLGFGDLWTPLDWAAETCRDPWTGLRRPMDTFGLGHGDLWTGPRRPENKCYQNTICSLTFTEVRWIFIVCIGGRMDLWRPMD